jgi:hypothetical protein
MSFALVRIGFLALDVQVRHKSTPPMAGLDISAYNDFLFHLNPQQLGLLRGSMIVIVSR